MPLRPAWPITRGAIGSQVIPKQDPSGGLPEAPGPTQRMATTGWGHTAKPIDPSPADPSTVQCIVGGTHLTATVGLQTFAILKQQARPGYLLFPTVFLSTALYLQSAGKTKVCPTLLLEAAAEVASRRRPEVRGPPCPRGFHRLTPNLPRTCYAMHPDPHDSAQAEGTSQRVTLHC